jgi:electron-transferring-flavoprotein dehydrogenase
MTRPADYPPPFGPAEFVVAPSSPPDERIEVGVLIVGAGPAGLACAIRLGQLLEANPDAAERFGDTPVAVLDKGRQPGSHLLSGAVLNLRSFRTLLGEATVAEMPAFGPVGAESVYVLTRGRAMAIPPPPTMRNHGNVIVSLSKVGRWLAGLAEQGGAMVLPETVAEQLLVDDGRVAGVRTGDKGRGPGGEPLGNFEPGTDIVAGVTVLAEGTQGHLTGVTMDHFGLGADEPQVWELGVKEVWRVPQAPGRIIHTMGWPLRPEPKYREFGGSFIYPMGADMLSIGMVVGLDYRDVAVSPHDLLQELKTHPLVSPMLAGGERLEWGAKTIPGGGFRSLPDRLHAPGVLLCGDGAGMVNVPTLKGVHYAVESGRLAADAAFAAITGDGALESYDTSVRSSFIWDDLYAVRDMRGVFGRGFFVGGALAGLMTLSKGRVSLGRVRTEPDGAQPLLRTDRARAYPAPDGKLTFDKLSSVFAAGNKTRDDQPNHIRVHQRVPRDVAELWANMCPAEVYTFGAVGPDGLVDVEISSSNCVQCGAISAKGGRLTPPEGASGPDYALT